MRVLLVEDDAMVAQSLGNFLRRRSFVPGVAGSIAQARGLLAAGGWAVVLLDRHLPDGDGLALLPDIRRMAGDASVIVLTARDQIVDRIEGLDAGADDYLVKPFDPDELLARLRAIERRRGAVGTVVEDGDLSIDFSRGKVLRAGVEVTLTAKEWALLRVLALRPDHIQGRDTLLDALYGFDDSANSNTLEVYVSNLRRKLGKNRIETLRGLGYRFVPGIDAAE